MSRETVNLKQLAAALGLSQTTVSRALNGFPEVSERTRERVVAAADKLNYRPSASAASLATGKARTIGHVVPLAEHMMINPHFSDFLAGAGEVYARSGYEMLIRVVSAEDELGVYRDLARTGRVDGFVVHGPLSDDPRIPLLSSLNVPFVVHGRCSHADSNFSFMDVNNKEAFRRATDFLLDLGHRRMALINGLETMNFASRRRQGFEEAFESRGLEADAELIFGRDMVEPYGYEVGRTVLGAPNRPTAILLSSMLPAIGLVRAMGELGLKAGEDVSIIVFDDQLSFLQSSDTMRGVPFFTVMRSSIRAAGQRVAEMLMEQINTPDAEPIHELWEAEFVLGRSTGPVPPRTH
ncbi:LacI family DNA-binding transcriptional regulator [Nitratireductor basaltis]|uniref:Transcriptional regulator, LacI family n=1 Tax=Nitratireductor basaltis TaxID=472175 RepID=A0A084U7W5_9HYPH|nr:substrate-binding domain-containing protein [Nitratireductor basaltis]KFB09051.1 Transcriptional regulator, LacI family [Nitratireductor basaltis]